MYCRLNDSSLFEARNTLARNSAQPLFCSESSRPCTARYITYFILYSFIPILMRKLAILSLFMSFVLQALQSQAQIQGYR